jgi:tripartite-type tricarboxylate transporter receptor subunit TctC
MNLKILKLCLAPALVFVSELSAHSCAFAQESYPSRPIKMIVPVPPGAAADILPRIVAEKLSARFGQPIVVENRPGANSNIGAQLAAKAPADGYTLLATPPPPLVVNQSLYSNLGFEPRAFVPISVLAALTNVLVVNPKLPFSSVPEMIEFAKANPGKLTYASAGLGSGPHLAMEWLSQLAAARMTHVPYNGLAQALTDVTAGHVDMMFNNTFNVLQPVNSGKLRALGVDSQRRVTDLPDIPAISEHFPGYVVTTWFAIVAPPQTPPDIVDKVSRTIADQLRGPDVAKRFRELGAEPIGSTPAATADLIRNERERWHQLIHAAGIKKH